MKLGSRRIISTLITAAVCLLGGRSASGQAVPAQKPQMAEEVFKNVQVLRGIPVEEFMGTMGFFSASLGLNCTACHGEESNSSLAAYADDPPLKQTARKMILMMNGLNKASFGGKHEITCYSCHRGDIRPKSTPSLAQQYGTPPPDDPDEIEISEDAPKGPSAEEVLDKYIQALGGAEQLAKLTSFVAKGTYEGYDTFHHKVPVDVFAKAPSQRTTVIHTSSGDSTRTFDGRAGWVAMADQLSQVVALSGGDLNGAKLDADLSFPSRIKQDLSEWRSDFPAASIDDRDVQVIQGTSDGRTPVKLYFDKQSGLLVRLVRYNETAVGLNPTQVDYSDYRDVSGVKIPYRWVMTWTDGQSTYEMSMVQPNAPIEAARFAKPALTKPKSPNP